jgi:hypothetical protein
MSCPSCEEAQKPDPKSKLTGLTYATYLRVGRANVLISGCAEHLTEIIEKLRKVDKVKR